MIKLYSDGTYESPPGEYVFGGYVHVEGDNAMRFTQTGVCKRWGSEFHARRVTHLTQEERDFVRSGGKLYLANCPSYGGCTIRRIVATNSGEFYCRMPEESP